MANIALVQVPGSVEEERFLSKVAIIKDHRRNRLLSDPLNACLVLPTQRMWAFRDFPSCEQCKSGLKQRSGAQQRRREPELMEISDESEDVE